MAYPRNYLPGLKKNYFYSLIAFYLIALSWSAPFSAVLGLSTSVLYYPVVLLFLVLLWYSEKVRIDLFLFFLFFMLIVLFIGIFKDAQIYINRYVFFPLVLLLTLFMLNKKDIMRYISGILTIYIIIAIILSIISFFYAYLGHPPIFEITNPDGRPNKLYLLSFTNAVAGNVIRPSFIYDEPGAFSFIICYVAILRSMLKQNKLITLLIMIGGLITLSLAHVLIFCVYLAFEVKKKYALLFIPIIVIACIWLYNQEELKFFFNRFKITESGTIQGDNRLRQVENFFRIANEDIVLFGNYKCAKRPDQKCYEHGDISSSVVTPTYEGGILLLFVQLTTSILLLWVAYKNKIFRFAGIAMFLLLLQRPYFSSIGYQVMVYTTLFFAMKNLKDR